MVSGNNFDTCGCKDWTSFLTYNACFPYLHSPVLFIFLLPHLSSPSLSAISPLMPTFPYQPQHLLTFSVPSNIHLMNTHETNSVRQPAENQLKTRHPKSIGWFMMIKIAMYSGSFHSIAEEVAYENTVEVMLRGLFWV